MQVLPNFEEFLGSVCAVSYQKIEAPLFGANINVWVRRDDLLDPEISGNKFYKLYFNLCEAVASRKTIVSAGGAYSNHIHALASAGYRFGVKTLGVIRGERPAVLSPTLQDAERWGMRLVFVSREQYRPENTLQMLEYSGVDASNALYVPEGGDNLLGFEGTALLGEVIAESAPEQFDALCVASGTGNTLSGLIAGLSRSERQPISQILGFSVLKGSSSLVPKVVHRLGAMLEPNMTSWGIISGFHCGGYGKPLPKNVLAFVTEFEAATAILLDPVYTAKLFWGVKSLSEQGYWKRGSNLLLLHTGGLQGARGINRVNQ